MSQVGISENIIEIVKEESLEKDREFYIKALVYHVEKSNITKT